MSHFQWADCLSFDWRYYQAESPVEVVIQIGIGNRNHCQVIYTVNRLHNTPFVLLSIQSLEMHVTVARTQYGNLRYMIIIGLLWCLPRKCYIGRIIAGHIEWGYSRSTSLRHRHFICTQVQFVGRILVVGNCQFHPGASRTGHAGRIAHNAAAVGLAVHGLRVDNLASVASCLFEVQRARLVADSHLIANVWVQAQVFKIHYWFALLFPCLQSPRYTVALQRYVFSIKVNVLNLHSIVATTLHGASSGATKDLSILRITWSRDITCIAFKP